MIQHQISLQEAIDLTTRFRTNPGKDMPLSETYDAGSVGQLLSQLNCCSFRIYLGRKADNSICSILVGVDENGQDILPPTGPEAASEDEGILLENALQCPPVCPPPSPLNS